MKRRKPKLHPNNDAPGLAALVQDYLDNKDHGPSLNAYLKFFQKRPLTEAIERAGFYIDGKGHGHQCLVGRKKLEQARKAMLNNIDEIKSCRSFEELHTCVEKLTRHIYRFGVLAKYDISLRVGANLRLWPEVVYLHAGTRNGCKALGMRFKGKTVEMAALPKAVQRLKPYHAENFLCIYKDSFGTSQRTPTLCLAPRRLGC